MKRRYTTVGGGGHRKRAEEHSPLEAQLQATLNLIPAHVWYASPSGALTFVNERTADYLGLPKDHHLRFGIDTGAEWDSHIPFLHPDDHEETRKVWSTCLRTGCAGQMSFRVCNAEGGYHWFLSVVEPLRATDGTLLYWVGVNLDIDDAKRAEDAISKSEKDLRTVIDTIPTMAWCNLPDGSNECIGERWHEYTGLSHEESIGWGWQAAFHPDDLPPMMERWQELLASRTSGEIEARIRRKDGVFRWFLVRAEPLRDEAGNIIRWYGTSTDIEDRKRAEQALQQSQFYLAEGQRLSHAGSWSFKPDLTCDYWSRELYEILGFDPDGGIPTISDYFTRIDPQDREVVEATIQRMIAADEGCDIKKRIIRPDGAQRVIRCVGTPIREQGVVTRFVGTLIDITEQEELTRELRRSEAYLAEAQRLSKTGSYAWSPDKGVLYWSDECYRVLGFDPGAGLPIWEEFFQRIHPDDQSVIAESIQKTLREKEDVESDYRIVRPSGAIRNIHSTGHPVLNLSGDLIELTGTVIDVTERKRAEQELRDSERKHRDLVDTTPAFLHTALPNGDLDFLNRGWLEYVGLPLTDLVGWRWTSTIHPEDVEAMVARWRASIESGERFVHESRVRRADGECRWFLHRKEARHNERGEIVKWYGSSIEIEERKIAEEKIREQEAELRQIVELLPQHIVVHAPDGTPLYANRTALEYFRLSMDEWVAKCARLALIHPHDRKHFQNKIKKGYLEGAAFELEARLLRHDGKFRCFLFHLSPIKDERGQITRWYAAGADIEDRKQAEEKLLKENIALREEIVRTSMFEEIIGTSPALKTVLSRVSKVAASDCTVLITGETGTGKELIARAIHRQSRRSSHAFVGINCAAIPRDLIASELFGHEKGAFTGATQQRLGRFELASEGTIFLDEVGELPAETQIALLRVLQEHEFERVGGTRRIRADVRVIAATNHDLQAAIAAGTFREDLFYRLHVFPIEMPSLRERVDDIPLLVEYFIDRYARKAGKNIRSVSKKTLDLFQSYPWRGNIRELQNVIERSIIVCDTDSFSVDESWLSRQPLAAEPTSKTALAQKLAAQEKEAIEAALSKSGGRVFGPSGAAAKLGIPRSTLESKIRSLKIDKNRFKISNRS